MSHVDPISDAGEQPQTSQNGKANGAGGVLATLDAPSNGVPAVSWSQLAPIRPEILSAKPNPAELMHAVRRRWTLAIGLGATAAALAMALVWYLVPVRYEVFSLLRVLQREDKVLETTGSPETFELFKRTHEQLIRSGLVLGAATVEPQLIHLPTMKEHNDDPAGYLRGQLLIDYPNDGEVLRVAMIGRRPDDLKGIVNMIVDKYLKEVVERERDERGRHQEKLQGYLTDLKGKISRASNDLIIMSREQAVTGTEAAQVVKATAMANYDEAAYRKKEIIKQINETDMLMEYMKSKDSQPGQGPPAAWLENQWRSDPVVGRMLIELTSAKVDLERQRKLAKDPASSKQVMHAASRIDAIEEHIQAHKADLMPVLEAAYATTGGSVASDPVLKDRTPKQLEFAQEYYQTQLEIADKDLQTAATNLTKIDSRSSVVDNKVQELERLKKLQDEVSWKLDLVNLERFAQPRITQIEKATLQNPSGDAVRKYIGVIFSGLLAFSSVVLAIGFVEFQSRRLNTPSEVSDGLGIRVVGQLPRISSHTWQRARGANGSSLLKALMAERMDGARTALIHTTDIHPPRVVMITSAEPREGKTTTASQLAASLARSGRRTLLVDADIRNPGMHRVFELSQEPGLCELLRGEAEREAAIQPTRTANLWLLPAGRCDTRSVQALATSYLGSTIAALAVQFDYVIIDSGPVLKVADPLMVGQHVDAAIVSVLRDVSQVPKVYEATERLRAVGITVLGSVVNGVQDDAARHGVELMMAEAT